MHWEALLREVLNKKEEDSLNAELPEAPKCKKLQKIYLGANHPNIYFTNREAEVMIQLLKGKTISAVAAVLSLSPRTIEFYVKNMKVKLACRTKSELIGRVFASEFVKNIDFLADIDK